MTEIYKPIISPVISYCCETWSLILNEEQIKRLLKNSCRDYLDSGLVNNRNGKK